MVRQSARAAAARDVGVVIVAAGSGNRFGRPKHLVELAGQPLLLHSFHVFLALPAVAEIVAVVAADSLPVVERSLPAAAAGGPLLRVVAGGDRRQASVLAGVESIGAGCEYVLVHDAARPLVRGADVEKVIAAARAHGAAVLGHACVDSVKAERAGRIAASLPREHTWLVQTPQAARRQSLLGALVRAERDAFVGSDEASILERAGIEVALVEGARDNLKVTFPEDLIVAEFLLKRRVT